jgi:hypothetical protein
MAHPSAPGPLLDSVRGRLAELLVGELRSACRTAIGRGANASYLEAVLDLRTRALRQAKLLDRPA